MRIKSAADRFRLGVVLSAFFICWGIWAVLNSGSMGPKFLSRPGSKTSDDCSSGSNRRCDPLGPTFYDDPTVNFSIENPMKEWDEKRKQWLESHPSYAVGLDERILVVSGSQPSECPHPSGDHLMLRFFKNKVDYCRRHGYDIFYNTAVLNPKMGGCWAKIQAIRSAMMAHPEAEWIFWIDSDAAFTDMDFKVPLERYRAHNLVVHSWSTAVYESWVSVNAGVFLIRNCQWGMEFLDTWAKMGPQTAQYEEWGRIQMGALKDKPFPASDDQSGMIYMLLKSKERWGEKTYVESEYLLHGYWAVIVDRLDNITRDYEARWQGLTRRRHAEVVGEVRGPILEGERRPFVTHFTGCQPCNGNHNPIYEGDKCWDGMKMALNFADNQVLRNYGFVHNSLLDSGVVPVST